PPTSTLFPYQTLFRSITEVGLVRIENGQITDRFQSLVNCSVRVPASITAYTGISQQMVDAAPGAHDVMRAVVDFIGDSALVAHRSEEHTYELESQSNL